MKGERLLEYRIFARIDPISQILEAKVKVKTGSRQLLTFCLHKDLNLLAITGASVKAFHPEEKVDFPFAPEARAIRLEYSKGTPSALEFEYRGRLGITSDWEVNRLTGEWIELGLYTPWFPLALPLTEAKFYAEISLPPGYRLIASGVTRRGDGLWQVEQHIPSYDCSFVAAPGFREVRAQANEAIVIASHSNPEEQELAREFSRSGAEILAFFNDAFGRVQEDEVHIVIAPRLKGGGYARRSFIVFGGGPGLDLAEKTPIYWYIAHEFAHLWWYKAETTTWEDWLNESLAEFSALMAVRKLLGEDMFEQLLAERRQKAKDLPPLMGIDRSSEQAHTVLYDKGCVLLAELEEQLGRYEFLMFLRELIRREVAETEQFLSVLALAGGKEAARGFAKKLRQ